jgi:hypothetical protein
MGLLPTGGGFNPNNYPEHQLFVGIEHVEAGTQYHQLRRYRQYEGTGGGFDTIKNISAATSGTWRPTGMSFGSTRSNRADWRVPGCPVTIACWGTGNTFMYLTEFPDDQNMASATPYDIFSNNIFPLGPLCCHQGRVVLQLATSYNQGPTTITFMGENCVWSNYNDVSTAGWLGNYTDPETGGPSHPTVFVPENPYGLAFMVSMSANEIFAVKGKGGLYVTGNLGDSTTTANPTIVSLPMVTGSEILQMPAVNNQGVTYGNRGSGIWQWSHGDNSRPLSAQMSPDFWTLPSPVYPLDDFGGVGYSFTTMDDWIICPHNWVYDTIGNGWWRLEDDTVSRFRYNTCMTHYLYCAESYFSSSYTTPISLYVRENPSPTYSWQSQPLWETLDTLIDIREITLRVRGSGSVKVTCTGETSSSSVTFNGISALLPVLLRQPIRVQDANIAVRIESTEPTGTGGAPTVYECNVGFFGAQRERITY